MTAAGAERRRFLKALGAGAASSPFYSALERSVVQAATPPPLRLLLVCTGYGGRWEYLRPKGLADTADPRRASDVALTAESISYPNSSLAPLAPFLPQMTVIEGVALTAGLIKNDGNARTLYIGHERYAPSMWTGSPVTAPKGAPVLPASESIEFALGQKLGAATAVRSLQLGVGTFSTPGTDDQTSFSYNAAGQRLPGFSKPSDAFRSLFGNMVGPAMPPTPGGDMSVELAAARDRKVIGAVQAGAKRLRSRLGNIEKKKLDEHLAALADIEARLVSGAGATRPGQADPGVSCKAPVEPSVPTDMKGKTQAHFSLIRQAFACDRVRYLSAAWGIAASPIPGVLDPAIKDMHNQVAHVLEGSTPTAQAANLNLGLTQRWHAEKLAELMKQLASDQDSGGTSVLDNTLIVWAQDFGHDVHGGLNVPYILLGGGQKRFRMGRYINVRKPNPPGASGGNDWRSYEPNNKLLVSILNGFGVPADTFGTTEFSGPLPGLLV